MSSRRQADSAISQGSNRAPEIKWEWGSAAGLPIGAFPAVTINGTTQYIGRAEVNGNTIVGSVIKGTGLLLPVGANCQIITDNFEVLIIGTGTVVEWKGMESCSMWPSGYLPVQGSSPTRDPTTGAPKPPSLIGLVEGVGIGHVEVVDKSTKICNVPVAGGNKTETFSDHRQFQLLCTQLKP